ncbi:ABC transporter ATP-binding protein [Spirosoma terrae]|uniref:ABC transporter ATP-binding protein n=1 Tax=Spirosoma terrae TaxID=1968276 RepID=A0A6L9LIP7_9BACT|nr:ABC transporter ATP-binding protein [Spirosoma terrae]NDU99282.1 ABC transporter ATP-binding protein [Spirosoma terrae]
MLDAQNITVRKQGSFILTDNSLQLRAGEICCIVGRNGAGKSTLLRALTGIEQLESGAVAYNDIDLLSADRYHALRDIGIMLSTNSFYEYLTCEQNLEIVQRYYGQTRFTVEQVMDLFGLKDFGKQKVSRLSSGTKQRLSLALVFINCPALVILDEPFNSIDQENTRQIVKLIRQLNKDYNTAFLITSHSFDDVGALYSRLCILKNGEIVSQLTRQELERLVFFRVRETELPITFDELIRIAPSAQRDDDDVLFVVSTDQQNHDFNKIAGTSSSQRPATPKDLYELFG